MTEVHLPNGYRPGIRAWMVWTVVVSGTDAIAMLLVPELIASPAYGYAKTLASTPYWGVAMMFIATGALIGLVFGHDLSLRLSLLVQACVHAVFGLSIFGLTLEGTSSAITGATKWWAYVVIPLFLLSRPFRETAATGGTDY